MQVIPAAVKKILDKWNIRGLVILSLIFQTFLIFLAPQRKRTAKRYLAAVLWIIYLLADWIANYAVAQITKNQGKEVKAEDPPQNKKLLALWAPFLLLHLGGPDTITALTLQDNTLWKRHFFGLISQLLAGVYAVVQSMENVLWPPITLLFVTGTIKYAERTQALYAASLDNFKEKMLQPPDTGPNYAKLMEEYTARKDSNLPTEIVLIDEPDKHQRPPKLVRPDTENLTDLQIIQYAYKFFKTFKGLVVDLIFSFRERDESMDFFKELKSEEALKIIEVELGFLYESMFTKTAVLHSITGTLSRVFAFGSLLSSFLLFHFRPYKHLDFHGADIAITYALFIIGIALELTSIAMFLISDWTFAVLSKLKDDPEEKHFIDPLLNYLLRFSRLQWKKHKCKGNGFEGEHEVLATPFHVKRWSGKIYGFNFIGYSLKAKVSRIHQSRFQSFLSEFIWESIVYIFDFIFIRVQTLSEPIMNTNKSIKSRMSEFSKKNQLFRYTVYKLYLLFFSKLPRGFGLFWGYIDKIFSVKSLLDEWRFVSSEPLAKNQWEFIFNEVKHKSEFAETPEIAKKVSSARGEWALRDTTITGAEKLMNYVESVDYDQSLLLWHIATELCFQKEEKVGSDDKDRLFSKMMSDYMIYLLIMQPKLMSEVAGIGIIRFKDTYAEARRFFRGRHIENSRDVKRASNTIVSVSNDIEPIHVKGDRSKSVLFDASMLAKELMKLGENGDGDGKWRVLGKVWVELLSYAASHCDATEHVAQLSRGGEVINFVWLLMAHFGLGDQFQINKGDARAKLVVKG